MENSTYVFISYAHRDAQAVLPCVEAMKGAGISLWYDEGIEAGSEWPEFIAQKVVACTKFVLFVSRAYLESQNCKRELNFAISRKKDILSVFLEDVALSPGMEMQLGTYQAIYRKRFDTAAQFHESLCHEHYFDLCRLGGTNSSHTEPPRGPAAGNNTSGFSGGFGGKDRTDNYAIGPQPTHPKNNPVNDGYGNGYQGDTGHATPNGGYAGSAPQSGYGNQATFANGAPVAGYSPIYQTPNAYFNPDASMPHKSRVVAFLLAFFLGFVGAQKFYLRQPKRGILYVIFCFTYIPWILSIIEALVLLLSSGQSLAKKYGCSFTL